jgi:putative serine protease PepD
VLAVGTSSTGGKDPWIGTGIVASVDGVVAQLGGPSMDGLIATGASPGKAGMGGALLDRQGSVAGILVAPVLGDPSTYAVPIGFAAEIAEQLGTTGAAAHGWLGVQGTDTAGTPTVTGMTPQGPAERAGIRAGDVVVLVGDRPVTTMGEVTAAIRWYEPGAEVIVKVRRGTALVNVEVKIGTAPANAALMGA